MSLLRLDSSIRQEGSVSREVADTLEKAWTEQHPTGSVVRRDLAVDPASADLWAVASLGGRTPEELRTPEQVHALAYATTLADELLAADAVVVATSLYNYGINAYVKNWIDLLIADPRFSAGSVTPLLGRPLTLVVARGGGYGPGSPREGWDYATPYLLRVFGELWGADVTLIEAELTLADVVPAMEQLRPIAAAIREKAHELAAATGKAYAEAA